VTKQIQTGEKKFRRGKCFKIQARNVCLPDTSPDLNKQEDISFHSSAEYLIRSVDVNNFNVSMHVPTNTIFRFNTYEVMMVLSMMALKSSCTKHEKVIHTYIRHKIRLYDTKFGCALDKKMRFV
jgi:hypothetical protein